MANKIIYQYIHVLNFFNGFNMVQTSEQLVSTAAERYLLIYMIAVLAIVVGLVIVYYLDKS